MLRIKLHDRLVQQIDIFRERCPRNFFRFVLCKIHVNSSIFFFPTHVGMIKSLVPRS